MKRLFIYTAFLGLLLSANSCSDKLNLSPSTQQATGNALSNANGVKAAVAGMYSGMIGTTYYGRGYLVMGELTGDNVYLSNKNSNRYISTYRLKWLTTDTDVSGVWNTGYSVILRANNIINSVDNVTDFVGNDKNLALGQALFIRALVHFDLVRFFAEPYVIGGGAQPGIPYITKFEVGTPARNTVAEVYTAIIADLEQAKTLLADAGTSDPFTASGNAASALLARVYLYQGNNASAVTEATNVINAGYEVFDAKADPDGFADFYNTVGTSEEIFTLQKLATQTAGSDNLGNMYFKPGYGDIRVSPDLVSTFETGDRRADFIVPFAGSAGEYQNNKFTGQDGIAGLYSPKVLRVSEMYLIRAEANAKLSKYADALDDVNYIREKRNLADLTGVADANVLAAVELETRKEFAFEGHRYFDKLRNNEDITRNYCGQITQVSGAPCTIPAAGKTTIFPIPQAEINVNTSMDQNEGYKQ